MYTLSKTLALWATAALCSCAEPPPRPLASARAPRAVVVDRAVRSTRPIVTEVVGTVRAVQTASIAALISGTVAEVRVGLGSRVRTGDVLVRLSAQEVNARLEQAHAILTQAARERDRAVSLRRQEVISAAQYDEAISQWSIARAKQAEASSVATRSVLRAPFAGVVTAKLTNVGDTALAGQTLLVVEAPGALRFEARVPEASSDSLETGQTAPVRVEGLDRELEGRIAEIQPASEDATRTRLVKLDLPASPGLRVGRFGRLLLTTGQSLTLSVPAEALVQQGQLEGVFVVDGGTARWRLVRSGRSYGGRLEIASGLSENEQVVQSSAGELSDGQRVQVTP